MQLSDFDYKLPSELIARFPLEKRSASRLLHLPAEQAVQHRHITDLPNLLSKGDLIVFNDTKVLKARLHGKKTTGGAVEILVERLINDTTALCHIRASKAPKTGAKLVMANTAFQVVVTGRADNLFQVDFAQPILPLLEQYGQLPIPPYFERDAQQLDDDRYQTVFHDPQKTASVAAPTASLHFDDELLKNLANKGIDHAFVTLHVGAGTFAPVRTDNILEHTMHSEYAELSQATAEKINATKAAGGNIVAVGTTVTRVLETAALKAQKAHGKMSAWSGDTDIFIYPSFHFQVIDKLITNFHLPKSTLLMLVAAFAGQANIQQAYAEAMAQKYRFFSYGDAMLLEKNAET